MAENKNVSTQTMNSTVKYVEDVFLKPLVSSGTEVHDLLVEISNYSVVNDVLSRALKLRATAVETRNKEITDLMRDLNSKVSDSEQTISTYQEELADTLSTNIP